MSGLSKLQKAKSGGQGHSWENKNLFDLIILESFKSRFQKKWLNNSYRHSGKTNTFSSTISQKNCWTEWVSCNSNLSIFSKWTSYLKYIAAPCWSTLSLSCSSWSIGSEHLIFFSVGRPPISDPEFFQRWKVSDSNNSNLPFLRNLVPPPPAGLLTKGLSFPKSWCTLSNAPKSPQKKSKQPKCSCFHNIVWQTRGC